jgi:histidinol-phosphate phosphatase family protein
MTVSGLSCTLVVPTIGRVPGLARLLASLDAASGPRPDGLVVVDDRPSPVAATPLALPRAVAGVPVTLVRSGGRGPAAARNRGARGVRSEWLAFLDDDVAVADDWFDRLADDLETATATGAAGSQAVLTVPLPSWRRPTDWERDVAGLGGAAFITADLAYRRDVFEHCGGFDEGFRHAYREDADLALRVLATGHTIGRGTRRVEHPVGPGGFWVSVRRQRNNAADARMRAKHGPQWRRRSGAPRGRLPVHAVTVSSSALGLAGIVLRRRPVAAVGIGLWAALTVEFARARIAPGPRTPAEVLRMVVTSAAIPPVAVYHRVRGASAARFRRGVDAVLFDRDGTLVEDVPANGDPDRVRPVPGAREAVGRLRAAGIAVGVVSNQHAVAQGLVDRRGVDAVNTRIDALVGPLGGWWYCPHGEDSGCACRKPEPGMVLAAARAFGCLASRCVVIGDTEADVLAARTAGAYAVLVPNPRTRRIEIDRAPVVASTLHDAVDHVLDLVAGP